MPKPQSLQVAGVDGCKAGWLVAIVSGPEESSRTDGPNVFKLKTLLVASTFSQVLWQARDCQLVCIDIPIGLRDGDKPRECDIAARRLLGGRRASSVFPAPIRPCLSAEDYKTACEICLERSGKKLSRQSFALLEKIRQVDDLMTPALQHRVREIHPEVSFWSLNNQKAIQQNKKTVPGQAQRHKLLQQIFTDMDDVLSKSPTVGFAMDDAFDALVAAWTAAQAVTKEATTLPKDPELDSKGLRMEILYPSSCQVLGDSGQRNLLWLS
jgi:predicted RNase H-like nuclease